MDSAYATWWRKAAAVVFFGLAAMMTTPAQGFAGGAEDCTICVSLCPQKPDEFCKGYKQCAQEVTGCLTTPCQGLSYAVACQSKDQ